MSFREDLRAISETLFLKWKARNHDKVTFLTYIFTSVLNCNFAILRKIFLCNCSASSLSEATLEWKLECITASCWKSMRINRRSARSDFKGTGPLCCTRIQAKHDDYQEKNNGHIGWYVKVGSFLGLAVDDFQAREERGLSFH